MSKKRRKTLPGSIKLESERKLRKWEEVSFETSGPWSTKSSRDNRYYAAFVDHKDGFKNNYTTYKKETCSDSVSEFCYKDWLLAKKILYSDVAGEFISRVFKTMFLAQGCNHIIVPKGDHHAIGKSESAVAEIDKMTRVTVHDATLPFNVWDFVVCHDTCRFYDHECHR